MKKYWLMAIDKGYFHAMHSLGIYYKDIEKDYDLIMEDDLFTFVNLDSFSPGKQLEVLVNHSDGSKDLISLNHTYNQSQIEWYDEGSALNLIKKENL